MNNIKKKLKIFVASLSIVMLIPVNVFASTTSGYNTINGTVFQYTLTGQASKVTATSTMSSGSYTVTSKVSGYEFYVSNPLTVKTLTNTYSATTSATTSVSRTSSSYQFYYATSTHKYSGSTASGSNTLGLSI